MGVGVPLNHPLRVPTPPLWKVMVYVEYGPLTVTVTTRIITFLVGDSYKPLFATVTGRGPYPRYMFQ